MFNAIINGIWTDERVEQLKKKFAEGLDNRRIAEEMGCFHLYPDGGRCAIIGKLRRLGLRRIKLPLPEGTPPRSPRSHRRRRPASGSNPIAIRASNAVAPPKAPDILDGEFYGPGVQVIHLTDENCHYPRGDPRVHGFEFCGAPAVPGLPWCSRHAQIVFYQPTTTT